MFRSVVTAVLPRLNGVLFGRQASVVAHRMKYVEAAKPFVARVDVRSDIAQRVSDVQTRTRRVGEHVEHVEFGTCGIGFHAIGFLFLPAALPLASISLKLYSIGLNCFVSGAKIVKARRNRENLFSKISEQPPVFCKDSERWGRAKLVRTVFIFCKWRKEATGRT